MSNSKFFPLFLLIWLIMAFADSIGSISIIKGAAVVFQFLSKHVDYVWGTLPVLVLLPLALGLGEGAELRMPMGITVIGGLLFSTLLTLVLVR